MARIVAGTINKQGTKQNKKQESSHHKGDI
jgi:hypothetical protein